MELPVVPSLPVKNPFAKTWAPVSYTTLVSGMTAGQTLMMPQVNLQSGFNTPYLVDEIRLAAYIPTAAATSIDLSLIISFKLWTGNYFFSQGFGTQGSAAVPMVLYAPTYSGAGVYESFTVFQNPTVGGAGKFPFAQRRWVLPKPLYMPPGDIIQATVSRDPTAGSSRAAVTALMTVIGRALPPNTPPPQTRQVPYVAWYQHPSSLDYSEATQQLQNPFTKPWHIQRLIMQTMTSSSATAGTGTGLLQTTSGSWATVRLTDDSGYKITGGRGGGTTNQGGGFVPLADIASPYNDAAWTFNRAVPPEGQINAAFQLVRADGDSTVFSPMMSLIGYRDE